MTVVERATSFDCRGDRAIGIFTEPGKPAQAARRGILIAIGGAQYRAGSHRQFTLMARHFAEQGTAVMRFDYRGMGDSEGQPRQFDAVDDDLRAAISHFTRQVKGIDEIVILGLCDAATAAGLYACADTRVSGLVLINPWVHTERGAAKATLKHYYVRRLLERDFWRKIVRAEFRYSAAVRAFLTLLVQSRGKAMTATATATVADERPLPQRLFDCLRAFKGRVLVLLSSEDLTAQEFSDLLADSPAWRQMMLPQQYEVARLDGADHTFSCRAWREQASIAIIEWNRTW